MHDLSDESLRVFIYDRLLTRGGLPPTCAEIARHFAVSEDEARATLAHTKIGKTLLVDPATGEIWMAGPFAAKPTPYKITKAGTRESGPGTRKPAMPNAVPNSESRVHPPASGGHPPDSRLSWYANCAWDMFCVASMVNEPVHIEASCTDCGEPIVFDHDPTYPPPIDGVVHVLVPARRWYDDIGFT